jgi:hypothetical protein
MTQLVRQALVLVRVVHVPGLEGALLDRLGLLWLVKGGMRGVRGRLGEQEKVEREGERLMVRLSLSLSPARAAAG